MELLSALQSSAIRFLKPENEKPVFVPDLVDAIRAKFKFFQYPKNVQELSIDEGIDFVFGTHDNFVIDKLSLYRTGLLVEGKVDTDKLDDILDVVEKIFKDDFDTKLIPTSPVSKLYGSRVEVRMTGGPSELFGVLNGLAHRFATMIGAYGVDAPDVQPFGFSLSADISEIKTDVKPGRFIFERRAGHAFSENVFFSEAPISTSEHLELMRELEQLF